MTKPLTYVLGSTSAIKIKAVQEAFEILLSTLPKEYILKKEEKELVVES